MATEERDRVFASKLQSFDQGLDPLESFNLNLLLSVAIGGLAPSGQLPVNGASKLAWDAGLRVLAGMHPQGLRAVGRAPYMTDELLAKLLAEASQQETVAHRTGVQALAPGGPTAVALSSDQRVLEYVSSCVGSTVFPTKIGSYMFYQREGDYLYPHVDTEVFAVNLITMLSHELPVGCASIDEGSALTIYEPGKGKRRVPLQPGESAIILASGTVHGRDAIKAGERVTILTIGFEYTGVDVAAGREPDESAG